MNKNHFLNKAALLLIVLLILGTIPVMIAGDESTHEVKFYTGVEEWELYETQYIESGNKLSTPLSPALPLGMVSFLGWSKQEDGLEDLYDFSEPVTEDFVLYAQFSNKYLISFKDAKGVIFKTQLVSKGGHVEPITTPPSGTSELFSYWAVGDTEDYFDLGTPVYNHIILRPIYSSTHKVYFNSMKGTPVDYQVIPHGGNAENPGSPTRPGYDFVFWSENPDAVANNPTYEYIFSTPVESSLTLYAVWKASTTNKPNVTVIIWNEKENLPIKSDFDQADYVYHDSYTIKATAGTTATVNDTQVKNNISAASKNLLNYSTFNRSSSTIVEGDGTSVINVYYNYKIYTITFDLKDRNATLIHNGDEYKNATYKIRAKYNMNLEEIWPVNGDFFNITTTTNNNKFYGWTTPVTGSTTLLVSKRVTFTSEMIPSGDGYTANASWTSSGSDVTLNYMFESLQGDSVEGLGELNKDYVEYNGKIYVKDKKYSQTVYASGKFDLKNIQGMEKVTTSAIISSSDLNEASSTNQFLLYNRTNHNLSFDMRDGTSPLSQTVLFGQNLTKPDNPTRSGYEFEGWYTETEYTQKFDFDGATMPDGNLMLFARWEPKGVVVSFYDQNNGEVLGTQNVSVNGHVRPPSPTDDYYLEVGKYYPGLGVFEGWYTTLSNGLIIPFDFSSATVAKDYFIFGLFETSDFKITYDKDDGTGTAPTDEKTYRLNTLALVKEASLTKKVGKITHTLAGWEEIGKNGMIYYPGSTIQICGDVEFKAVYADPNTLVNLIYDSNFGTSEQITDKVIVGKEYALRDNKTFKNPGYVLKGWAENAGDTVPKYQCGECYTIPAGGKTLYAVWEPAVFYDVEFKIRDTDIGKGKIITQSKFRVENGSLSAVAIPTASRPQVELLPDVYGKIRYEFSGWNSLPETITSDYISLGNFRDLIIDDPTVMVRFVDENGDLIKSETVDKNGYVTAPGDREKTGYDFKGWQDTEDFGSPPYNYQKAEIDEKPMTEDTTYQAVFEIIKYNVRFIDEDENDVTTSPQTVEYNKKAVAPIIPEKEGYILEGWKNITGDNEVYLKPEIDGTPVTGNTTYQVVFKINKYTVQFLDEEGTVIGTAQTIDYNNKATAPENQTKTGYTFTGWNNTTGVEGLYSKTEIDATAVTADVTYQAVFEINNYTITFDSAGGSSVDPIKQNYNTEVTAPAEPTKTGYTFDGWDKTIPTTMPAENITITAKWKINQYTIAFDS
ncbi:MAG: InlB B-repeat-containing protein, partial [Methanimicrococcus sp.]|nr:InlB B-repeat-containing protein [Methanimicrococcus sp.]